MSEQQSLQIDGHLLQVKCKKRLEATAGVVTYNEVAATVLGKTGQRNVEVLLILSQSGTAPCCCSTHLPVVNWGVSSQICKAVILQQITAESALLQLLWHCACSQTESSAAVDVFCSASSLRLQLLLGHATFAMPLTSQSV